MLTKKRCANQRLLLLTQPTRRSDAPTTFSAGLQAPTVAEGIIGLGCPLTLVDLREAAKRIRFSFLYLDVLGADLIWRDVGIGLVILLHAYLAHGAVRYV